MRNRTLIRVVVAVTALALVGSVIVFALPDRDPAAPAAFSPSDVVAVVNGEAVTKAEVYEAMWSQGGPRTVEALIARRLVEQEARRRGVRVDAELDAEIAELIDQYGDEQTLELLYGTTIENLREDLRVNLLVRRLLEPEVEVSEDDVRDYFEQNPEEFVEPEQVQARHILVEDRDLAADLLRQLTEGADFAQLAEEHSIDPGSASGGGDLGWFGRGHMVQPFEEAAFGAEPGSIVGPVETQFGFHVIEVLDRKPERQMPLEEVRDQIREMLVNRAIQDRVVSWLQSLRDAADVEIRY